MERDLDILAREQCKGHVGCVPDSTALLGSGNEASERSIAVCDNGLHAGVCVGSVGDAKSAGAFGPVAVRAIGDVR